MEVQWSSLQLVMARKSVTSTTEEKRMTNLSALCKFIEVTQVLQRLEILDDTRPTLLDHPMH